MDDELLDLVDRSDKVTGTVNRMDYSTLLQGDIGYIRASELFILNSKGEIYVPTRTAQKTIAPNGYDYSVSGHVGAGEDYLSTIIRETKEELNLHITEEDIELIDKTILDDIKYIRYLYLLKSDEAPECNPNDFVSAKWMNQDELVREINEGHTAKSTLVGSVSLLKNYLATT